MRIFNEVWCSYSIPLKTLTQVIYTLEKIEVRWKEFKLSSGHRRRTSLSMNKPTTWCKSVRVSLVSSSCLYKTQPERALAQVCYTRIDALNLDEYQFHLLLHQNFHHGRTDGWMDGRTDRQTDEQGESRIHPTQLRCRGYNNYLIRNRDFHEVVIRPSYHYNGNPYTYKTSSQHWYGPCGVNSNYLCLQVTEFSKTHYCHSPNCIAQFMFIFSMC